MATTAVSISEYLSTSYEPDCDYIDGEIQERNAGELDHSRVLGAAGAYSYNRRRAWGIIPLMVLRVQVAPTRIRVADVCVLVGGPTGQILREPPFICIEVLSPEDRVSRINEKIADYLRFGVPYVWLIDPQTRKAWRCTPGVMMEVSELRTEDPTMVVPIEELFD